VGGVWVVLMMCASLMPSAGSYSGNPSNVVDIFNVMTGAWSTAVLSVARYSVAATSLPNAGVAIFAGGESTCCFVRLSCYRMGLGARGMHACGECGVMMTCASLMPSAAAAFFASNVVDIFNVTTGAWSTAVLSVGRFGLAATSLPNAGVAIFAGGGTCCCVCLSCCRMGLGARGMHEWGVCGVMMTCASLMPSAGNSGTLLNVVDIFNVTTGAWSTAALSQVRYNVVATSLPNAGVVIFAGGLGTCCCVCLSCCRMGLGARVMTDGGECGVLMTSLMPCSEIHGPEDVVDLGIFCSAGFVFVVGSTSASWCAPCPARTFSLAGSTSCTACDAGTFNPSAGSSSCLSCPPGSYSDPGQAMCSICPPGTYTTIPRSPSCTACDAGTHNPSPGGSSLSSCLPCDPGSFSPSPASAECSPCSSGSYCPNNRSTKGLPCDAGYFCPSGSSVQTPCPQGSFCQANAGAPSPCPQNTYGESGKLASETQCTPCPPGKESGSGALACSSPCIPNPLNVQTFQCYSTEGKVVVVLTWCASLFSAVFFPFKVWAMYKYRRGKLVAKGVRPTLKHLIFFRTALSRAVSLQPLIGSPGGDDVESKPKPPPEWSLAPLASGGAAASEAAHGANFHQTSQIDAVLRINADLQQKLLEQERRMKEQEERMKEQEQRTKEQERAIALLQQQSASSPRPRSQCDDA
jgi:hypothetical protein